MLDAQARRVLERPLSELARLIDRPFVSPNALTLLGLATGLASAGAAASLAWWWSLALWLFSRAMDGLDGPLARRRQAADPAVLADRTLAGGFLDITADITVYGATVVGVAVGATRQHDADWLPFLLVLFAYYVNGAAFLAFSSVAERAGRRRDDGRSLSFFGRLAEGGETVAVHSSWLLFPGYAEVIAVVWAGFVALSAVQRIVTGFKALS